MSALKFKIFSHKENRFLSESDIRLCRLAISVNGEVYSGTYDCIVDGYDIFQFTNNVDANGEEVYEGDLLFDARSIISVERGSDGGFWPFTEIHDYLYNGEYKDMVLYKGPKHREYIFKNAVQTSEEFCEVLTIASGSGTCDFHGPSKRATVKVGKKTIGLENASFETMIERSNECIIGDRVQIAFLEALPVDAKITGDLVFESL